MKGGITWLKREKFTSVKFAEMWCRSLKAEGSFSKSVSSTEKLKKLFAVIDAEDIVALLINADPDAMARSEVPVQHLGLKSRKGDGFEQFVLKRVQQARQELI